MNPRIRSLTPRALFDLGLELLPWLGLALGVGYLMPSQVRELLPGAPLLAPSLVALAGLAVVLVRRMATETDRSDRIGSPSAPTSESISPASTVESGPSDTHHGRDREQSTRNEARTDHLTGLATRSAMVEQLNRLLRGSNADNHGPAVLVISIDEYRDVTESFGYESGQELLAAAAVRIDQTIPPTAMAARISEDSFAILLTRGDESKGVEVGEALMDEFAEPFDISGREVPLEASIGLAAKRASGSSFESAENMLHTAYAAMHQAARNGNREINLYASEDSDRGPWLERRERLRQAIQNDELILYYQPIVHLVSGKVVGAEALVRWNHPERGLLSPAAFIPLAEETGLVGQIDRWVVSEAMKQAEKWTQDPEGPVEWVSVNVSPQSTQEDLQSWCMDQIRSASLPEGALHLEITERWALEDERALHPLRDEGVRLAIDDFGTGYSSLRYLRSLEADVLKIDREFIKDLGRDEKTTAIVQFLLNLSLRLDVSVIAEGVENQEQEDTLRELGCAMAQGYHFSEPVPPEVLAERIRSDTEPTPPNVERSLQPA